MLYIALKPTLQLSSQTNCLYCSSYDFQVNQKIEVLTERIGIPGRGPATFYIFCSQIKGKNLQLTSCPSLRLFKIQEAPNQRSMRKDTCPRLHSKVFRKAKQTVCLPLYRSSNLEDANPKYALSQDHPLAASCICTNQSSITWRTGFCFITST